MNRSESEVDLHAEVVEKTFAARWSFEEIIDLCLQQNSHRRLPLPSPGHCFIDAGAQDIRHRLGGRIRVLERARVHRAGCLAVPAVTVTEGGDRHGEGYVASARPGPVVVVVVDGREVVG